MTTGYWCEQALLPGGIAERVRLTVDGDRITAVDPGTEPAPGDERLSGLVRPGFANGHSHAFHRALRGRTQTGDGTFWTWREAMYAVSARLTPENYRRLATAVFAEMVTAGYTVVGEFHYLHGDLEGRPYGEADMERAIVAAARDAGIRLTLLDTLYLAGGLGPDGYLPLGAEQRRFSDGSVEEWAARRARLADDATTRIGAAIHSVRALPPEHYAAVAEVVGDAPLHTHVSEQPAENASCEAYHHATPTTLLAEAGLLGRTFTAVHATHLTAGDIAMLGEHAAYACLCPTTEADLADGIGPAVDLHAAGARLTLGTDQHVSVDPFVEVRMLEGGQRLTSGRRGRFGLDALDEIASGAGYASLGWPHGGRLAVGALADFVAVRLDSARTAGADPAQVLHAATAADVADVVGGGEWVVRGGEHRLGDVGALLAAAVREVVS